MCRRVHLRSLEWTLRPFHGHLFPGKELKSPVSKCPRGFCGGILMDSLTLCSRSLAIQGGSQCWLYISMYGIASENESSNPFVNAEATESVRLWQPPLPVTEPGIAETYASIRSCSSAPDLTPLCPWRFLAKVWAHPIQPAKTMSSNLMVTGFSCVRI